MSKDKDYRQQLTEVGALLDESRHLSRQLFESHQSEKRALEQFLHDDLGQALVAIKSFAIAIGNLDDDDTTEAHELAQIITDIADAAYVSTYDLMREVRAELCASTNLAEGIQYCFDNSRLSSRGITQSVSIDDAADDLDNYARAVILRTVQECLTKAIRSGNASHVKITAELAHSTQQKQPAKPRYTNETERQKRPHEQILSRCVTVKIIIVGNEPVNAEIYNFDATRDRLQAHDADFSVAEICPKTLQIRFTLATASNT